MHKKCIVIHLNGEMAEKTHNCQAPAAKKRSFIGTVLYHKTNCIFEKM